MKYLLESHPGAHHGRRKVLRINDLLLEKAAGPLPGAGPACFVINNVSRILSGHEIFSLRRARGFYRFLLLLNL